MSYFETVMCSGLLICLGCSGLVLSQKYKALESERNDLKTKINTVSTHYDELEKEYKALEDKLTEGSEYRQALTFYQQDIKDSVETLQNDFSLIGTPLSIARNNQMQLLVDYLRGQGPLRHLVNTINNLGVVIKSLAVFVENMKGFLDICTLKTS